MNANFIRTILNWFSGAAFISIATEIAKCRGDIPATPEVEAAVCGAAWIPIEYQAIAGTAFVVIGFLLKMFSGYGASVTQNIAAPVVPVVPKSEAKVGVVTPEQVATPGPAK